ncbi:MAG: DUF6614 family protein [Roseinatronobacter sp.]
MITYLCMIDLKPTANALAFAHAADQWFGSLKACGKIEDWMLQRRKLHLAGPGFGDFMVLLTLRDLEQMGRAFAHLGDDVPGARKAYDQMHGMIEQFEVGLYRSYPDAVQAERLALI